MKRFIQAIVPLVVTALLGCGQSDPAQLRIQSWRKALGQRMEEGPMRVRYNPVTCDCPAWEAEMADGWFRVNLVASERESEPLESLSEQAQEQFAATGLAVRTLPLRFESSALRRCPNGTPYFDLVVIER